MRTVLSFLDRFGESITVNGEPARGFISPINAKKHDNIKTPAAAGVINAGEYLLITSAQLAPCGGEEIAHGERHYLSLRAEARYFKGGVSHY